MNDLMDSLINLIKSSPTLIASYLQSRFSQEILIIKKGTVILLFIVKSHTIFVTKCLFY